MIVTAFLSNDATAVVLTPAVYAAARKGGAEPLTLLFACAMVANAASFVLPISNPANLVLYGRHMPPLGTWLHSFALPSLAATVITFVVVMVVERASLRKPCERNVQLPNLSRGGWTALTGIIGTALLLIVTSALDQPLGLPTLIAGITIALGVSVMSRCSTVSGLGACRRSWRVHRLGS